MIVRMDVFMDSQNKLNTKPFIEFHKSLTTELPTHIEYLLVFTWCTEEKIYFGSPIVLPPVSSQPLINDILENLCVVFV